MRGPQQGFSVIELAVAVLILTLLLGSILVPLATQVEQRKVSDTRKALDEIREALIGFAIINGRLPCPDTDSDRRLGVRAENLPAARTQSPRVTFHGSHWVSPQRMRSASGAHPRAARVWGTGATA